MTQPSALSFTLLRLLSDGEFHSGEKLAAQLGISRASVNNALRDAPDWGLTLHRVKGRGYCLRHPPEWLSVPRINAHLGRAYDHFNIEILEAAPSSNTLMLERAANGAPSGSVLAVEWQTAGRGRMGRAWHSELGNSLTFSMLWRFDCGVSGLSGLSLAVGVALVRALRKLGVRAALKWPNDILGAKGKLAGVLIEAQGDMLGPSRVVIGVGLNIGPPRGRTGQPVACMAEMTKELPERNLIFATVLTELEAMLREFAVRGFAAHRAEWESCHALQNKPVVLTLPNGDAVSGKALGVDETGALRVETRAGVRIYNVGEMSLRGLNAAH
jgi:BirA family transcriptional regulator, biotin operon repressor / biotin---[acetyl-CoA-carboxylase] ligase